MNISQPFSVGDHVIAPSLAAIIKQGGPPKSRFDDAVIVFAHPTNGWCSFRYEKSGVTATYFNDSIFFVKDFEKRFKQNQELMDFDDESSFEDEYDAETDAEAEAEARAEAELAGEDN